MIVQESDILLAALDRRLQVDRILSLDPLTPIGRAPDQSRTPQPGDPAAAPVGLSRGAATTSPAASQLAARLPLGSVINARVTAVPQPDHVVAEVGSLRIELAWPAANGPAPRLGGDVALRVLAHTPMLLFQRVTATDAAAAPTVGGVREDASATRWSSDAMRLQTPTLSNEALPRGSGTGPVRFDTPILGIEIVPRDPHAASETSPSDPDGKARPAMQASMPQSQSPSQTAYQFPSQPALPTQTQAPPPSQMQAEAQSQPQWSLPSHAQPPSQPLPQSSIDLARLVMASTFDPSTPIALDDVVVARHTAFVDGIATPLVPRNTDETTSVPVPFAPLVLQGPAWLGQPVELVVRREREDDQFENAALDHWCGEVLIDLPNLGRVAAHLSFSMKGLKLRIEGDDSVGVDAMTGAALALASALADADLRVSTLTIAQPAADALRAQGGSDAAASVAFRRANHG